MAGRQRKGRELQLEAFIPYRLSVVTNRISQSLATIYQMKFGITIPEWRIMAVLGRYEPLSALEICERTSMDKARVSRALARMHRAKLILRKTDREDRRRAVLRLSAAGNDIYRRIAPLALDWEDRFLAQFTTAERRQLTDLIDKLWLYTEDLPKDGGYD